MGLAYFEPSWNKFFDLYKIVPLHHKYILLGAFM